VAGVTIELAVVDDDRMLVEGLRTWADRVCDLHLVAVCSTVSELLGSGVVPAVVVLDLMLRDGSSPASNVERISAAGARVLVVSAWSEPAQVAATFAAGARGYLTKDHDLATLAAAIREVAGDGVVYSPELADALLRDPRPQRPRLSGQERAVLVAYASGMTLKAAARMVGVQPETASSYLKRVKVKYSEVGRAAYTKTDLANRVREDGLQAPLTENQRRE
jgi:DNA-binding NarL/FixJ family response regulator